MSRTRVWSFCFAVALVGAAAQSLVAQNNQNRAKLDQQDVETVVKLVDGVAAGAQPAPADIPVAWESNHFFKGANDSIYVPFTLAIDASKLAAPSVALYIRVVSKEAAPVPPVDGRGNDRNRQNQTVTYPWAQAYFVDVPASGKIARPMQLKPGTYEVFVLVRERTPLQAARNALPLKAGLLRRDITIPDYGKPDLMTSSVLISTAVEPLNAPLTAALQLENPYALGGFSVVPSADGQMKKSGQMQVVFFVYGAGNRGGKPDVQIEYNFHQKTADGEKYFNKMAPQDLNAQTLPPQFDLNAGHLLFSIVDVPLTAFPVGDYRLELKITDKVGGKSITENATFSVLAG